MKLLFVETARITWLFQLRRINPLGLDLLPLIKALAERFHFVTVPKHSYDTDENGALAFTTGSFTNSKGKLIQVGFKAYNDGIIVDTFSHTDDCLEFLDQLCVAIGEEGYESPTYGDTDNLGFFSQIRVKCDRPLVTLNPKLERFAATLSSEVRTLNGAPRVFEMGGIALHAEDVGKPLAPIAFRFERKHGSSFSSNEYFAAAPLETDKHLEMLNKLELLLKD